MKNRFNRGRRLDGCTVVAAFAFVASMALTCSRAEPREVPALQAKAVLATYADLAFATYRDAAEGCRKLRAAAEALVENPSETTLEATRTAWVEAREPYLQTEVFRFYGGPIDRVELLVNTWPIDENFIEDPGAKSGIVDDVATYPVLSGELLASLNAKEGETSVSTGYHAIEFLLWGSDTNDDGPGNRPYTDFGPVAYPNGKCAAVDPGAVRRCRRSTYLVVATDLLLRNLSEVAHEWARDVPGNYRARFERLPAAEAMGRIIKGMGALGSQELAGERLTVAYETKDQENEHSCFSDNTTNDIIYDAVGVENVWLGRYTRAGKVVVTGPSPAGLLAQRDPMLARELEQKLGESVDAAKAIPTPFDLTIRGMDGSPGRRAIRRTIDALRSQTETLTRAAEVFGADLSLARSARR